MAHCGYEPTAANIAFANPLKMFKLAWQGLRTEGGFAPEIDLSQARTSEEHHERIIGEEMARLKREKAA
jgi:hypothetical protein